MAVQWHKGPAASNSSSSKIINNILFFYICTNYMIKSQVKIAASDRSKSDHVVKLYCIGVYNIFPGNISYFSVVAQLVVCRTM